MNVCKLIINAYTCSRIFGIKKHVHVGVMFFFSCRPRCRDHACMNTYTHTCLTLAVAAVLHLHKIDAPMCAVSWTSPFHIYYYLALSINHFNAFAFSFILFCFFILLTIQRRTRKNENLKLNSSRATACLKLLPLNKEEGQARANKTGPGKLSSNKTRMNFSFGLRMKPNPKSWVREEDDEHIVTSRPSILRRQISQQSTCTQKMKYFLCWTLTNGNDDGDVGTVASVYNNRVHGKQW